MTLQQCASVVESTAYKYITKAYIEKQSGSLMKDLIHRAGESEEADR